MGQGQEIIARNYLAASTTDGQWLLLQNTHLGLAYLSEVSRLTTGMTGQCSTRCAVTSTIHLSHVCVTMQLYQETTAM